MARAGSFVLWGPDHLTVLGLTIGGIAALLITRRQFQHINDVGLRRGIAIALFGNEFASWVWAAVHGVARIPLQLCDLALLLTVAALWSPTDRARGTPDDAPRGATSRPPARWSAPEGPTARGRGPMAGWTLRPRVCELAYFWGIVASSQAILTPDLQRPFPDYWWLKFFTTHCGVVMSAVYLALTGRIRLTRGSIWRVWGMTNLYAGAMGLINWRWGTNYGYLARKPMQPSLLDAFGPWPIYIAVMDVAALALLCLAALPLQRAHA